MGKQRHPRGGEVKDPFDLKRSTRWIIRDLYDAESLTGTDLDRLERAEIAGENRQSVLHAISIQRKLRHGRRNFKVHYCNDCGREVERPTARYCNACRRIHRKRSDDRLLAKNRVRRKGMTDEEVRKWNEAHPIDEKALLERLAVAFSGIYSRRRPATAKPVR